MKNIPFVFVLQARNGSTRLPNKVTRDFYQGQSILEIIISKLNVAFEDIPIILATSSKEIDNLVADQSIKLETEVYRGSENDVLKRMVQAASKYEPAFVIRVCCDNPLIDVLLIQELISAVLNNPSKDYYSFFINSDLPVIKSHLGVFTEVISYNALKYVDSLSVDNHYREHVTNYLYESGNFELLKLSLPDYLDEFKNYRLTVDDQNDFELVQELWPLYLRKGQDLNEFLKCVKENQTAVDIMKQQIAKYQK